MTLKWRDRRNSTNKSYFPESPIYLFFTLEFIISSLMFISIHLGNVLHPLVWSESVCVHVCVCASLCPFCSLGFFLPLEHHLRKNGDRVALSLPLCSSLCFSGGWRTVAAWGSLGPFQEVLLRQQSFSLVCQRKGDPRKESGVGGEQLLRSGRGWSQELCLPCVVYLLLIWETVLSSGKGPYMYNKHCLILSMPVAPGCLDSFSYCKFHPGNRPSWSQQLV